MSEEIVSPELALVDPVLAERTRAWLPEPEDTLERVERMIRSQRIAASRTRRIEDLELRDSGSAAAAADGATRASRTTADRRSAAFAGGVTAFLVVTGFLVGVRIDVGGSPAGVDSIAIAERSAAGPKTPPPDAKSQGLSRPTKAPTPHRFVWAPADRASGYDVAFFRGSSLVFSARTTRPEVSLPTKRGGSRQTLEPGKYRWYVWPVVSGLRAAKAIVQAKLVVPRRSTPTEAPTSGATASLGGGN